MYLFTLTFSEKYSAFLTKISRNKKSFEKQKPSWWVGMGRLYNIQGQKSLVMGKSAILLVRCCLSFTVSNSKWVNFYPLFRNVPFSRPDPLKPPRPPIYRVKFSCDTRHGHKMKSSKNCDSKFAFSHMIHMVLLTSLWCFTKGLVLQRW